MSLPTITPNYRRLAVVLIALSAIAGALTGALYLANTITPETASTTAGTITGFLVAGLAGLLCIEKLEATLVRR